MDQDKTTKRGCADWVMQDTPKVSVIIPTYNRDRLLPRAVNSVLAQTYDDYEIIIVDDCSTDDTQQVVAAFADSRIRHFRHEVNKGVSAARNTGIANARGEYIAFLDDDDEWLPTRLAKQSALMDAAPPKVGFVYGWMDVVYGPDDVGKPLGRLTAEGSIFSYTVQLKSYILSTVLARASSVQDIGYFDENMVLAEDLEFMCRLSRKWDAIVLPEVVYVYYLDYKRDPLTTIAPRRIAELEVEFINRHIAQYERELRKMPEGFSAVLRRLAVNLWRQGSISTAILTLLRAFRRAPMDTCRALVFSIRSASSILMPKSTGRK